VSVPPGTDTVDDDEHVPLWRSHDECDVGGFPMVHFAVCPSSGTSCTVSNFESYGTDTFNGKRLTPSDAWKVLAGDLGSATSPGNV
jgi:hypothetical protein